MPRAGSVQLTYLCPRRYLQIAPHLRRFQDKKGSLETGKGAQGGSECPTLMHVGHQLVHWRNSWGTSAYAEEGKRGQNTWVL